MTRLGSKPARTLVLESQLQMRDDAPPPVEARSLTKHLSRFTVADAITINCGEIFGLMVPDDAGDYNLFDASVDAVGIYIPFPEPARMVATRRNGHPLAHIIVIQRGVFLRDLSFWLVAERIWPIAAITVVTLTAATWLFRR